MVHTEDCLGRILVFFTFRVFVSSNSYKSFFKFVKRKKKSDIPNEFEPKLNAFFVGLFLKTENNRLIGLVGKVFANGTGDRGSIPGWVIPKTLKMVLDTSLLNTQQYKVRIKGKVEQSRERSSALPYTSV